jgi:hypothetical protein
MVRLCVGCIEATPGRNNPQLNQKKSSIFFHFFFDFLKIGSTAPPRPPECAAVLPGTTRSTGKYPQARDEPNSPVSHPLLLLLHSQILPPQPNHSAIKSQIIPGHSSCKSVQYLSLARVDPGTAWVHKK